MLAAATAIGTKCRAFPLAAVLALLLLIPQGVQGIDEPVADGRKFEGQTIQSITFNQVARPIPVTALKSRLPFRVGEPFHARELRGAIQSLYSTGRFTQISVEANQTSGGLALRFVTTPAYFVGHVAIHGTQAPPNQDQLLGAAKLQLGTPFTRADTQLAAGRMTSILRNNGFYSASIQTQIYLDDPTEQASVDFFLELGKRARYGPPAFGADPGLPTGELNRATHWQRLFGLFGWDTVSEARTRQGLNGLRQLFEKRGLIEADIKLSRLQYQPRSNRAVPVLSISPGPLVSIEITGARIHPTDARQLLPIYQERRVDDTLLAEGAENIQQYLQSQGFFDVQATYKFEVDRLTDSTSVTYVIRTGVRRRFVSLIIRGNRYFSTQLIRERLSEQPATFPRYPHGRFSQALLEDDIRAIENLYQANGFRDVKVTSQLTHDFHGRRGSLAVSLKIAEGPQSRVASLSIEGAASAYQPLLKNICSSIPGQPFSDAGLAADRENILNYYYDLGHPDASFEASITPEAGTHDFRVRYTISPGQQTFINQIVLSGLRTTRRSIVLNRIELHAGEPLSLGKQTESQRNLYDLGVFARVKSAIQNPAGNEDSKDILFDIDEAKHYSLNAGFGAQIARIGGGVTSLDNPAGTTGFAPRLTLGITRDNLLGLGQRLALQTAASTIEQRAALTYFIPQVGSNPNLSLTALGLLDVSNDIRTYTAHRREASIQLGQHLSRAYTLQYRLVFRNVTLGNLKIDPLLVPLLSQPETVGTAEVSFISDKRDDPTDARHGTYTTVDLGYAPAFLGSQTQFGRLLTRNSTYYQITRDLVFARSTQFGVISRTGGRADIPLAERLYSGGSTSIRAFPDFQAGPRDLLTGFPLGGDALFINNLEVRFPLYGDNISAVLFQDAGNVYSSLNAFSLSFRQPNLQDFNYMVQDIGLGIRYRTPIGPVRVDLSISPDAPRFFGLKGTFQDFLNGTAISTVQKINAFQFHISLGQAF